MDFLKALEKAKGLGISKDEFLPIYMQEINNKLGKLAHPNLEWKLDCPSDESTPSGCGSAAEADSKLHECESQHQIVQKPSQLPADVVDDLKAYIDNIKECLCSQFRDFQSEATLGNERLSCIEQDMNNFLTVVHDNVQTLLANSRDSGLVDKIRETNDEMFNRLTQTLIGFMLEIKQNNDHSQKELFNELYYIHSKQTETTETLGNRQEELSLMQASYIQDSHNKQQLLIQQWKTELSTFIKDLMAFSTRNFKMIYDFENSFRAEMQKNFNTQELLLTDIATICSDMIENQNSFQKRNASFEDMQTQNEGNCCNQTSDILNEGQKNNTDRTIPAKVIDNDQYSEICISQFQVRTLSSVSYDLKDNFPQDTRLPDVDPKTKQDDRILSKFESSSHCNGSLVSVIYEFYIQNMSYFLEFKKTFQKVTYDEKLGCCLRASIFSTNDTEVENMLHICLDICPVGKDIKLPDLLRVSSEITLINRDGVLSFWNVAKEKGLFHMAKIRKNGWFEVCAAFLDPQSLEFIKYIQDGTLSFYYNVTVLHLEKQEKQVQHRDVTYGLSQNNIYDSNSDDNEFNDATEEENSKQTLTTSVSLSEPTSESKNDETPPQSAEGHDIKDLFTAMPPHSTFIFPVCELSALVASKSIVDSQDWYLDLVGHCVHAVLAFLDDATVMICVDHFHGTCCTQLPEFAFYGCRVSLLDQTEDMEDLVLVDAVQMFDVTQETPADWMENCICMISCDNIQERFTINDRILLQFEFYELI